jgi:hypothetical protein
LCNETSDHTDVPSSGEEITTGHHDIYDIDHEIDDIFYVTEYGFATQEDVVTTNTTSPPTISIPTPETDIFDAFDVDRFLLDHAQDLPETSTHSSVHTPRQDYTDVEAGQLSYNAVYVDGPGHDERFVALYNQPLRYEDSDPTQEVHHFRDIGQPGPQYELPGRHELQHRRGREDESLVPGGPGAPSLSDFGLPIAPYFLSPLMFPLFNKHLLPTHSPFPRGGGSGDHGPGPSPPEENLDPDLQRDISDDSVPDQDGGGGPDGDNNGPDEAGYDSDTGERNDPAMDDNGHRHTDTSPMKSPGSEGPPAEDEPMDGDPDKRRGGNSDGGAGERGNNKGKKRPAEKDDDTTGPEKKKKPKRRPKQPKRKKEEDDNDNDNDNNGEDDESNTGSEQTTSRTRTTETSSPTHTSKTTDDEDDECERPGNKAYFTFILHYTNLSDSWETAVAKRKKGCPSFISFDHGDHTHILFGCSGGSGNATLSRGRMTRFLSANSAGIAESIITMQRIKHLRKFLLYCIRYGIERTHLYGSPNNPHLSHGLDIFKQLFKDRDPNEVIHMAGCEPYAEMRKDVKTKRLGNAKSTHLADIIIHKILETNVMSAQEWEDIIDPDFRLQLIKEFGLTVDSYIQKIIRVVKSQKTGNVKRKGLSQLLMEMVETEITTDL